MKKIVILFTLVLTLVGTQVMAMDMMVGGQLGIGYNASDNDGTDATYKSLTFGIFGDFHYARIGLDYYMNIGDLDSDGNYVEGTLSFFNISALGKYPVAVSDGIKVWPALGLEYAINIDYEIAGVDQTDNLDELSDLYLLAGLGADFNINESIIFTGAFVFGYNLTPDPDADVTGDYSNYKMDIKLGVGMKI